MNGVSAPAAPAPHWGAHRASEPGPPPSPFCSSGLTLSSFCPHCQLLSPPFSASLGTQCHCSGPPWLSLGALGPAPHRAGRHGVLRRCQRQRARGLWCRGRELGRRQPWDLTLGCHTRSPVSPAAGAGGSSQPWSSRTRIHRRAEEGRVPPLLCSDLGRRLWWLDDF